ncbi:putative lipid II flippase FtsW [Microbacterium karelineae]|uniref:putative lipid II flippase FtsW n=1 Tax=Microbacterium karelineae TaxID=2654283 RepID=UPI0012EABEC9|nr:putative lipid II flippase FtsW [Microbacterium karelineae]
MTQAARPPKRSEKGPLAARIALGRSMRPVPVEFLLIGSSAILLTAFGAVMVFSATTVESIAANGSPYNDGVSHLVFAAVGLPLMFVMSRFSVPWLRRLAWPALVLGIGLQLLVFTPLGFEFGGNRNWLDLEVATVQPSEFLKLALVLWISFILHRKRDRLTSFWQFAIPVLPGAGFAVATVLGGQDLGTATIIAMLALGAMFFAGVRLRFLAPIVLVGAAGVAALAIISPNRMTRILSVFDPDCDPLGECYQPYHGLWGLAGGGILGRGLGNSREKYNWLPAAADDYIFAIVGEELGLLGCLVVLALFAVLAVGIFRIVRRTDDLFVRAAAGGIGVWIIGQALVNIGVVLRVLPALGVPLPFLSAGGSSLLAVLLACGVLLALARTLPDGSAPVGAVPAGRRS